MNTPEDDSAETLKGINAADLLARGLESARAATGNPQAWHPPTPAELAALLPQYEIEELLGRGGMGAVYRGKQAALDRPVAIKLLPAELAADAEFVNRFQREARTLAKLQHPGIVAVHDFGQTSAGHLYFVMEFVSGTDLSRLIHGPGINPVQALEVITQICDALQYAHSQGVIHRDIKPANVLINQEGRAKLADFGLARPTSDESGGLTRSHIVMGTPDYMAPEQMAGTADHRADLYALGVMLYEMLTGQTPRGAWAPPSQRVQVDVRLDQVVVRALQQDPEMRYQQASEIKTDVDVIRTTPLPKLGKAKAKNAPAAPGQRTTPMPKAKKPGNKLAIAAVIILPLLAVAGLWVMQSEPKSAASSLPWQKAVWSDQDRARVSADGWLTTGDELKSTEPQRVPGERLKFTDGALRALVRFQAPSKYGPSVSVWLRMPLERSIAFLITHSEIKATLNGDNGAEMGRIAFDTPFRPGDVEQFEAAAVGNQFVVRFKGKQLSFLCPEANRNGAAHFHGQNYGVKDVEYAILDGISDPLKALGWEVPEAPAPSATPWHKLGFFDGHQDPELIQPDADGWIRTGKGRLHVTAAEQPGKRFIAGDTALRFRLLWTEENIGGQAGLWFRTETKPTQPDGLVILEIFKDRLVFSERDRQLPLGTPGPTLREMTFSQPFKAGNEALLEVVGIGNTVYARVNGQQAQVTISNLRSKGWVTLGGWGACFRDAEYRHLDGIADPLKALGWDTPLNPPSAPSPWRKIGFFENHTDPALIQPEPDGWITRGHKSGSRWMVAADQPGKRFIAGDTAFRFRSQWTEKNINNLFAVFFKSETRPTQPDGHLELELSAHKLTIREKDRPSDAPPAATLHEMTFPRPFQTGDEVLFEIAGIGDTVHVRVNGQHVQVKSAKLRPKGWISVGGGFWTRFKDAEYVNLDGISDPLKALGWDVADSGPAVPWKPLPMDSKLADEAGKNDGWARPFRWYPRGVGSFADGAVRLNYRWTEGAQLWVDLRSSDRNMVQLKLNHDGQASLIHWQDGNAGTKASLRVPRPKEGDEGSIELAVVGSTAYARVNGESTVLQGLPQPWKGTITVGAADAIKAPAVKDVEYAILDGMSDPLNALGWDLGAKTAPQDNWSDFMAEWDASPGTHSNQRKTLQKEKNEWRSLGSPANASLPDEHGRSLAVRVTGRFGENDPSRDPALGTPGLLVHARRTDHSGGDFTYGGSLFRHGAARLTVRDANGLRSLKEVAALSEFNPDQSHTVELRTEGDLISLHVDGREIASVRDATLPPGGKFGIGGSKGVLVEKAEYRFLDDGPAALPTTAWSDFMAEWESDPALTANLRNLMQKQQEGWLAGAAGGDLSVMGEAKITDDKARDLALRATARFPVHRSSIQLVARERKGKGTGQAYIGLLSYLGNAELRVSEGGTEWRLLEGMRLPNFDSRQVHTLELQTQGNRISFHVDGVEAVTAEDSTVAPGGLFGIHSTNGVLFEKVEYRFLDEPSAAPAQTAPGSKVP